MEYKTEILFISNILNSEEFEKHIKNKIELLPVLDYMWKFKKFYKKEEEDQELPKKPKRKGFFARRKERKAKKEKIKLFEKVTKKTSKSIDFKIDDINYKMKKLKSYSYRGDSIPVTIIEIKEVPTIPINNKSYLEVLCPQDYLLKYSVFGNLNKFYRVLIKFSLSKEVSKFLTKRNFVMFDIKFLKERVNYHSIVLSKQEWKNFRFVHATDLHLAERNDRIYSIVKKWTQSSIKQNVDSFLSTVAKKLNLKKLIKNQEEALSELKIPLRKRLINPNNQFRKFLRMMNKKVLNNELDFIVLTGDLVDYTVLSRLAKQVRKLNDFKYEESNWKVFKEMILNSESQKNIKGVIRGQELLCPIFTIVGNHDYRPYHYDITWAEMYKKIGLNAAEAIALNELFSASPITAIVKSTMALKGYLSDINSSFDYSLTLGNNNFIFLNSGSDSFKNFRDLITGHPSVTGLLSKQITYLENLINYKIKDGDNTFLFLHGPPINTGEKRLSIKLFEKKGSRSLRSRSFSSNHR